jgi:hypothetical protein
MRILARLKTARPQWRDAPPIVALVVTGLLLAPTSASAAIAAKPFGIAKFTTQTLEKEEVVEVTEADYRLEKAPYTFTQAGGHPWALSTTVRFTDQETKPGSELFVPTRDPKDIVVDLPPGLLGDPNPKAFPQCSLALVLSATGYRCPADTQIGVFRLDWFDHSASLDPIVNLTPEKGQSAEFGLENSAGLTVLLTAHVVHSEQGSSGCALAGGCYGLTVVSNEIPLVELAEVETTFWGVPADPSHDPMRGMRCLTLEANIGFSQCEDGAASSEVTHSLPAGTPSGLPPAAFLTMPTDCEGGPLVTTAVADSWEEPGRYMPAPAALMPGVTGCDLLQFGPELEVLPDKLGADEPVGLGVNLKVPQVESPNASATPQLRDTVLTLPEGLSISPGIVDGIQACNESGPEGINFTGPESEEKGLNGELQLAPGHCPDASIVGTAKAFTPLLDEPVEGHVYLARPLCGGAGEAACTEQDALDGRLYRLYLELGGHGALAGTGVNLKVAFDTEANPATGQLTAVVENTPQLPFSKLEVKLNGGPRAPLDNPAVCGRAVTTSDLTPWSEPGTTPEGLLMAGTPDATPSSHYEVGGCSEPTAFAPGFTAGTVTPQAGQFSSFTLNLSRQDREQYVKGIELHTPPGLLAMLSSVPLCGEVEADAGTCPEASKIGTTRVASGAGSHPFEIEGKVYLTGPYRGAPFGLSIVTHAVAGPFNLGLVVVRARIDINPENSTATITTDETGPYAIPQIVFGVPLRLQRVTVDIDRPGFMFNPTSCAAQQITAEISGSQNAVANVSSPFAVAGCSSLAFKPTFKVSTSGKTSRVDGASLDAKLIYPAGSAGSEANIARFKVDLPKQLPSRLTTLQKACPAATFESNPAACPAGSVVGVLRVSTPVLPVQLSGPAYFVSHGGEAFPSLIFVLQGDGVRVDVVGSTFISKAGITSSTLKSVPDVPFSSFELYLPEGKYSALAANGDLCTSKLAMPTEMMAQNGARIKQSTKVEVSGCPVSKAKAKKKTKLKKTDSTGHGRARR